jgi:transforming growth factor-beta-induced protein
MHTNRASRTRMIRTAAAVAVALGLTVTAAACGGDDSSDAASTTAAAPMTTTTMAPADTGGPVGPACGQVPMDGEGSFAGMTDDTAATAASNNPLLSTLVGAVVEAGLVDTLNSDGPFTIFAPVNDAFAALPEADLKAVLADKDLLTSVLTLHVVAGEKLSLADLVAKGSVATVNGAMLTLSGDAASAVKVGAATIVCGNVPTANATVHIIDTVLLP